jgi:hypothetical protein
MSNDLTNKTADAHAAAKMALRKLTTATTAATPSALGRLIFALDATASREPTWNMACEIQGAMFTNAAGKGLQVQLMFYRADECKSAPFVSSSESLYTLMKKITCQSGATQIERVLHHAARTPCRALVFIGDAMEEEPETLYVEAKKLGSLGIPAFMFHERERDEQESDDDDDDDEPDEVVERTYRQIARLSGGVYAPFNAKSAAKLGELLGVVAQYATGKVDVKHVQAQSARLLIGGR